MTDIRIRIAGIEKTYELADESWINQQIERRRVDGQPVCVQVTIRAPEVDMRLSTPTCASNGGGGRRPNHREQAIFELWDKFHLNAPGFTVRDVVSFLKQAARAA